MPVTKVKGGYRWGKSGKIYKTKKEAERQGRAIYASGYNKKEKESVMDWIKGRLKEPSSYGAAAVVGVGLGILLTLPILTWAGIICAIFGLVLKEKSSE